MKNQRIGGFICVQNTLSIVSVCMTLCQMKKTPSLSLAESPLNVGAVLPALLPRLARHDWNVPNLKPFGRCHEQGGVEQNQLPSRGRSHVIAIDGPVRVKLLDERL